jgi:hypothetical protein
MNSVVQRAIPTRYRGILFRSKLEADWAITMDALAVAWDYEPEGRYWGDVYYAPDFWLPDAEQWFEVKGNMTDHDLTKWRALVQNWQPDGREVSADGAVWVPRLGCGFPDGVFRAVGHKEADLDSEVYLIPEGGFICLRNGQQMPEAFAERDPIESVVAPFPLWSRAPGVETGAGV